MSKAAVLGGTGVVGTGAAALTGAHYMGAFGGYDDYVGTTTAKLTSYNGQCLDRTFGNDWTITNTDLPKSESFPSSKLDNSNTFKGCLAFNWEKKEKSKGNWEGNFRFVWSLAGTTKGFVVYLLGNTETSSDGKLEMKFGGVAYAMGKNQNKWKVTGKLELKDKKFTNDELLTTFPMLDTSIIKDNRSVDSYLGFLDGSRKAMQGVKKGEPYHKYIRWEFKGGSEESSADPWASGRLEKWWNHSFGKDKWNMVDTIKEIKGQWTLI